MIGCVTNVLEVIKDCKGTVSQVLEKISKLTNANQLSSSLIETLMYNIRKIENDLEFSSHCLKEQFSNNDVDTQPPRTPEPSIYPDEYDWQRFKFITQRKGAYGPSRGDCLRYYEKT